MNFKQLTQKILKQEGFDGLFNVDGQCACKIDNLFPCDFPYENCEPGYIAPCNGSCDNGHCNWHIKRDKPVNENFITAWEGRAEAIHENAKNKGWWSDDRHDGVIISLIHSELSEALEALRNGNQADEKIPHLKGVEVELADAVIRIMDYGKARNLRIAEAIEEKIKYNITREYKHGGKRF